MKQAVLKAWDLPWLSVTALILFFVCFSLYTWWTYRRQNKDKFDRVSLIPLEDAPMTKSLRKEYE
jgi:cbb3-type cytochrome oxidase subunit 3